MALAGRSRGHVTDFSRSFVEPAASTSNHVLILPSSGTSLGRQRAGARELGGLFVTDQTPASQAALTIPRQAVIEGLIEFPGPMVVSGTIEGDVVCVSLIITERGVINGSVRSDKVTVLGEVNGEVYANSLILKAACSVTGAIYHNDLVLENGCYFEGKSRRMILPLQAVS